MTELKGIIFDLDQTLLDRNAAFRAWLELECTAANVDAMYDRLLIMDNGGYSRRERLLAEMNSICGWQLDKAARQQRFEQGMLAAMREDHRVAQAILPLRQRYRVGLLSNGRESMQAAKAQRLNLASVCDPLWISGAIGMSKPNPDAFMGIARQWQLDAE